MRLLLAWNFLTAIHSTTSAVVYAFALFAGTVLLLCLIRLIRFLLRIKGIDASAISGNLSSLDPSEGVDKTSRAPANSAAQAPLRAKIIRLSPQTSPTSSSEMTQQQKIAAALAKAGMTNSWETGNVSAQTDKPEPSDRSTPPSGQ